MRKPHSMVLTGFAAGLLAIAGGMAAAQELPNFVKNTFPKQSLNATAQELAVTDGKEFSLPAKYSELIGLAVAATVPCRYCIYYHQKAARKFGASEAEIRDALYQAGVVRQFSTILNGMDYSEDVFKREVDKIFSGQ
jgi:AhpD family alkylhydroperoxidase